MNNLNLEIAMLKWISTIIVMLVVVVIVLSVFLAPNSLSGCDSKPSGSETCRKADAIVALSGGDTMARADAAIQLYQAGFAPTIIFSGAAADPNSPSNAEVMKQHALSSGVPDEDIIVEDKSNNTKENAIDTVEILKKNKYDDIILTTSPYHIRRSIMEFKRSDSDLLIRSYPAQDTAWNFWWIKPSGWWLALTEVGGIVSLVLRGSL